MDSKRCILSASAYYNIYNNGPLYNIQISWKNAIKAMALLDIECMYCLEGSDEPTISYCKTPLADSLTVDDYS